jgi:hypothetical protein
MPYLFECVNGHLACTAYEDLQCEGLNGVSDPFNQYDYCLDVRNRARSRQELFEEVRGRRGTTFRADVEDPGLPSYRVMVNVDPFLLGRTVKHENTFLADEVLNCLAIHIVIPVALKFDSQNHGRLTVISFFSQNYLIIYLLIMLYKKKRKGRELFSKILPLLAFLPTLLAKRHSP